MNPSPRRTQVLREWAELIRIKGLPLAVAIFLCLAIPSVGGWAALLMAISVIFSIYRLATGPRWYHRR